MRRDVGAEHGVDLVLSGLEIPGDGYLRKVALQVRQTLNQSTQSLQLLGSVRTPASLVFDDAVESEQRDHRCVRMNLDLKSPGLFRKKAGAVQVAAIL